MIKKKMYMLSVLVCTLAIVVNSTVIVRNANAKYRHEFSIGSTTARIVPISHLSEGGSWYKASIDKSEVTQITISRSLPESVTPDEIWDASNQSNKGYTGYLVGTDVYICYNDSDSLILTDNASETFADFTNLQSLTGLEYIDSKQTSRFDYMFRGIPLEQLDLSNLDFSQGLYFVGMFEDCVNLNDIKIQSDIDGLDYSKLFKGCRKLTSIPEKIRFSNTESIDEIASGCAQLTNMAIIGGHSSLKQANSIVENCTSLESFIVQEVSLPNNTKLSDQDLISLRSVSFKSVDASKISNLQGLMPFNRGSITEIRFESSDFSQIADMYDFYASMNSLGTCIMTDQNFSGVTTLHGSDYCGVFGEYSIPISVLDLSGSDFSNVGSLQGLCFGCPNLKVLRAVGTDFQQATSIADLMYDCVGLEEVNLSKCNLTSVETALEAFCNVTADTFDISEVAFDSLTYTDSMFCSATFNHFTLSGTTFPVLDDMQYMFQGLDCPSADFSQVQFPVVTNTSNAFDNAQIDVLDLSQNTFSHVEGAGNMFLDAKIKNIVFNPDSFVNVVDMGGMFNNASFVTGEWEFPFNYLPKLQNATGLISNCDSVTSIRFDGTSLGENSIGLRIEKLIDNCGALTSIDMTGSVMHNIQDTGNIVYNCNALTSVVLDGLDYSNTIQSNLIFSNTASEDFNVTIKNSKFRSITSLVSTGDQGKLKSLTLDTCVSTQEELTFNFLAQNTESLILRNCNLSKVTQSTLPTDLPSVMTYLELDSCDFSGLQTMAPITSKLSALQEIKADGCDFSSVKSMTDTFTSNTGIKTASFTNCNFNSVTSLQNLMPSQTLTELDLSGSGFESITELASVVSGANPSLKTIRLSNAKFPNVTYVHGLVQSNNSIVNFLADGVYLPNLQTMRIPFNSSTSLARIDLTGIECSSLSLVEAVYNSCKSLKNLNSLFDILTQAPNTKIQVLAMNCTISDAVVFDGLDLNLSAGMLMQQVNAPSFEIQNCTFNAAGRGATPNFFNACVADNLIVRDSVFKYDGTYNGFIAVNSNFKNAEFKGCTFPQTVGTVSDTSCDTLVVDGCSSHYISLASLGNIRDVYLKNLEYDQFPSYTYRNINNLTFENCVFNQETLQYGIQNTNNLETVTLRNVSFPNATQINRLVQHNSDLTKLVIDGLDVSKATNLKYFISSNRKLEALDLSSVKFTSEPVDLEWALYYNNGVKTLNIGDLPLGNAININYTFGGYNNLESLGLSDIEFKYLTSVSGIFLNSKIGTLTLRNLSFPLVTSFNSGSPNVQDFIVDGFELPVMSRYDVFFMGSCVNADIRNVYLPSYNSNNPIFANLRVSNNLNIDGLYLDSAVSGISLSYLSGKTIKLSNVYAPNMDYVNLLTQIPSKDFTYSNLNLKKPTTLANAFSHIGQSNVDLSWADLSDVTNIEDFLSESKNVSEIHIETLDGSKLSIDTSKTYFSNTGLNAESITWHVKDLNTADLIKSLLTQEQVLKSTFIYDGGTVAYQATDDSNQ